MTSMETDTIEEELSVHERLLRVKKAVQKATQEALKHTTIVTPQANLHENDDPNASFHLGMELFGQEASIIERNVQEKLGGIEQELEDLRKNAHEAPALQTMADEDDEDSALQTPEQLEEEIQQLKTKILFLRECSLARSLLDDSITLSSSALAPNAESDFVQSAERLVQAQKAASGAETIVHSATKEKDQQSAALAAATKILDPIRSSMRRQQVDLVGRAKALWQNSISLTPNSLAVKGSTELVVAYKILEIMAADGSLALEDTLRKFAKSLQKDVFHPILESHLAGKPKTSWTFTEVEDRDTASSLGTTVVVSTTKRTVRRLEWSRDDDDHVLGSPKKDSSTLDGLGAWKDTIAFIQRIIVFAADNVLLQQELLCSFVGNRLFGKPDAVDETLNLAALGLESCRIGDDNGMLMEPLIEALEPTCIPSYMKPTELGRLHSTAEELRSFIDPFQRELKSKHLLSPDGETRLGAFVSSFEQKYVENRRGVLLNEARNLLMHNDYHNTVQVGVDIHENNKDNEKLGVNDGMAVFKLHKCSISDTAFKLMELCRKSMDEAVDLPVTPEDSPLALLPATLYRAAREVLDLFRAIIPVTHGHEVASVPRTAAVLHNDCVFFAHHCLTLGLEYKKKFPSAEPNDSRGDLLRQTCIFVDMVPLFRDLADRSLGDMLDKQAKQIVELVAERITLLGQALRSDEILVEWSEAESALAAGLYHLRHLSQAWKPVLSYDVMNLSMCYLADVIFSLFLEQMEKAKDISANACQFVSVLFQKATYEIGELVDGDKSGSRFWDRFDAVGRFMDMSLANIQVACADGVFRSVTEQELSRLIRACFDDSPKRQYLLKLLSTN